jgi:ComEC/Rec2-related protein
LLPIKPAFPWGVPQLFVVAFLWFVAGSLIVTPENLPHYLSGLAGLILVLSSCKIQPFPIFATCFSLGFFLLGCFAVPEHPQAKPQTCYGLEILKFTQKNHHATGTARLYINHAGKFIPQPLRVKFTLKSLQASLTEGQILTVTGKFHPIQSSGNPGAFDAASYYRNQGIIHEIRADSITVFIGRKEGIVYAINKLRKNIGHQFDEHMNVEDAGIAKALLLGDSRDIDAMSKHAFEATGSVHVLAVSGMHVVLFVELMMIFFQCFSRFINRTTAIILGMILVWFYALLTGFSPSVVRAVLMFTVVHLGQILGRQSNANHSVIACAFIMVALDPKCFYDIGFQLSFLAVLGIIHFNAPIERQISFKNKVSIFLWKATSVTLAAQILTVPLTLYYFHSFPNYFLLANLGVALLSTVLMYLGFFYLAVCWIPGIGTLASQLFSLVIQLLHSFVRFIAQLPGAIEGGFNLSLLESGILMIAMIFLFHKKMKLIIRLIPITVIMIILSIRRNSLREENHIFMVKCRYPCVIIKNGSHCRIIAHERLRRSRENPLGTVVQDYQKLYPCTVMDTLWVKDQQNLQYRGLEIHYSKNTVRIDGNDVHWNIDYSNFGHWKLSTEKGTQDFTPFKIVR